MFLQIRCTKLKMHEWINQEFPYWRVWRESPPPAENLHNLPTPTFLVGLYPVALEKTEKAISQN